MASHPHKHRVGRGGGIALLTAIAIAGCVGAPAGTGASSEGKVASGRKVVTKPSAGGTVTGPTVKPAGGGLGAEKPDELVGVPQPSPKAASPVASASPGGFASSPTPSTSPGASPSFDPSATPTAPPSTAATPIPEPTDGPIQRVSRFWGARVLVGGRHGTPADGVGVAGILGQNLSQAPGLVGLPLANPTRLYFADTAAHQLRSVDIPADAQASGGLRLELGDPNRVSDGGPVGVRGLRQPTGLGVDASGRLLLAERDGNRLWRYDPASYNAGTQATTQTVTELAGSSIRGTTPNSYQDGLGNQATFFNLASLAMDGDTAYLADAGYLTVRKASTATASCPIEFVAGPRAEVPSLFTDPPPLPPASTTRLQAQFMGPRGVAVGVVPGNAQGTLSAWRGRKVLYVAESIRNCIRAIDLSDGATEVLTVVGASTTGGSQDGALASATLKQPWALAVDGKGLLYVGEMGFGNHRLRAVNFETQRVETVVGEATEGSLIRPPDGNIPRGQVNLGHVGSIFIVNGPNPGDGAARIYLYDYGAMADTENPALNVDRPGPRLLELKPIS